MFKFWGHHRGQTGSTFGVSIEEGQSYTVRTERDWLVQGRLPKKAQVATVNSPWPDLACSQVTKGYSNKRCLKFGGTVFVIDAPGSSFPWSAALHLVRVANNPQPQNAEALKGKDTISEKEQISKKKNSQSFV